MTRQAALPDDSLPHWRESRLEGRTLRNFAFYDRSTRIDRIIYREIVETALMI